MRNLMTMPVCAFIVMAGFVPAIRHGTVQLLMAGTSPAMTMEHGDSANGV
jgi:hypothetical protein